LSGYFDPARPARLEAATRSRVNYEYFYFADAAGKKRFDAAPLRWCGTVTDPVSLQRFRPTEASAHTTVAGIPFYFESEETSLQFAAHPDSFAVMRAEMREMPHDMPESMPPAMTKPTPNPTPPQESSGKK